MPKLDDFFAIVSVSEDGHEAIMHRTAHSDKGSVVVPMVTSDAAILRGYKELAKAKILKTGEVIRIVHFARVEALDIGEHDLADSE